MAIEETGGGTGQDINRRVRNVVHEGNVRYVRVSKGGRTYVDVPLTLFIVGVITGPILVVIGLVTAVVTGAKIEFGRPPEADGAAPAGLAADIAEGEVPDETGGHA